MVTPNLLRAAKFTLSGAAVGGELHFSEAWGEFFLGRNRKFLVLPGGGTDPG